MFYSDVIYIFTLREGQYFRPCFDDFRQGIALFVTIDDIEIAISFEHPIAGDDVLVPH
jgi:hypothetical protein